MKTYLRGNWFQLACVAVLTVGAFVLAHFGHPGGFAGPAMGMAISFNQVPSALRTPFVTAEFDSSRAAGGAGALPYRAMIIGQKTSAGSATADSIVRVTNVNQVITLAGRGSMLHRQAIAWFANNKSTDVSLGVLADNGAGVLATKTLTFTGTATAAGTLALYIGGEVVQVAVASGDANTAVATATNAAIALALDLPVSSGVSSGVVTLTARNKGTIGQDLDVRVNYQDGEALPAGVAVAIANATSGITNPSLAGLIATMGDTWFHIIAHPYTDATSLTALETELESRFSSTRMIDGLAVCSAVGSVSTLDTLGGTRNSSHNVIVSQPGESPITPPCEFAAAVAAQTAISGSIDPARPLQTLQLVRVKSPAEVDLFTMVERNLMLYNGIGSSKVGAGGVVQIERLVTTYKTAASGAPDTAYLDANTMLTLMYLRYTFRNRFALKFPRHKLANDGTKFGAGQAIITPKLAKAEAVAWFREMEELGLVEGFDQFKTDLIVERNLLDPNRLDILLSPDLINQLVVTAAKFQFLS